VTNSRKKITVNINSELELIVPRFLELRHEDIESIHGALEHGNFEIITRMGHSMKGSGTGYGFDYISEIGEGIEAAGRAEDAETVRRWVEELSVYIENLEIVYDE